MTVLYMGTKTHDADLAMVMPAFAGLAARIPGLRLRVVGGFATLRADNPEWLEVVPLENAVKDYPAFVPWLRGQAAAADFAIAPLVDTPFNRWKSGLKSSTMPRWGCPGSSRTCPSTRACTRRAERAPWCETPRTSRRARGGAEGPSGAARPGQKAREWVVAAKLVPEQTRSGSAEDGEELVAANPGRIGRR